MTYQIPRPSSAIAHGPFKPAIRPCPEDANMAPTGFFSRFIGESSAAVNLQPASVPSPFSVPLHPPERAEIRGWHVTFFREESEGTVAVSQDRRDGDWSVTRDWEGEGKLDIDLWEIQLTPLYIIFVVFLCWWTFCDQAFIACWFQRENLLKRCSRTVRSPARLPVGACYGDGWQ